MYDKNPKISIIVPVYKAENYLHRCVDSILAQSFTDFELLLIDDGSPDKSGEICDEYAKKDSRVHVFHKKNGGVSSARQCGIDNAKGEYTIHADPDDWVESNMLEELYHKAKEDDADMVICDYIYEYKNRSKYSKQSPSEVAPQSVLIDLLSQYLHGSCCNKLIRRACYQLYNITFPPQIICWEDLFVVCNLLLHPLKVAYHPKAYYHYDLYSNNNSLVRKISKRTVESQLLFCEYFKEKVKDNTALMNALCVSFINTKKLMFYSQEYSEFEIINTFPEVNKQYIQSKPKFRFNSHVSYCLYLTLIGKMRSANFIHELLEFKLKPILKKLIQI